MTPDEERIPFEEVVEQLRREFPGQVEVVSYEGLKFAVQCGIDVWDYAETLSLQRVIAEIGTPAQKQRLKEELIASRWTTEIAWEE